MQNCALIQKLTRSCSIFAGFFEILVSLKSKSWLETILKTKQRGVVLMILDQNNTLNESKGNTLQRTETLFVLRMLIIYLICTFSTVSVRLDSVLSLLL